MKRALLFSKAYFSKKFKKISFPSLGSFLSSEPNVNLRKYAFLNDFDNIKKVTKKQGWFYPWPFSMWGINMTNTRISWALCHPACGGVIPVSPLSPQRPKTWLHDWPVRQPIGRHTANPVWFINSPKTFSIESIPICNYMFLNRIKTFCSNGFCWAGSSNALQKHIFPNRIIKVQLENYNSFPNYKLFPGLKNLLQEKEYLQF